jgi:hypothetical protein
MSNPTGTPKQSKHDLVPAMKKASDWLMADSNRKVKDALEKFGVPYGTFWLYHERAKIVASGGTVHTLAEIQKHGGYDSAWFRNTVTAYYREGKASWGTVMVRFDETNPFGISEGKCRKAFEQATNVQSEGQRTGKGGRWFGGAELHEYLYRSVLDDEPNRKAFGTDIEPGTELAAKAQAIAEERAKRLAEAKATAKRAPKRPAKSA